jgi:hypothetical protein
VDLIAKAFEHLCDGDADLREDLIDDAGHKQGDTGAHSGSLTCPESSNMVWWS